ncbi:hypothetical protein C6499_19265 [Candidatus Poribacteria bacterium]|nr:MAG: hypothetical protein C6499_19265 [Candidatus Poribacteria bacterium]
MIQIMGELAKVRHFMLKIAVVDQNKQVLEPCHPAVARQLLRAGKAAVLKQYPFTIILKRSVVETHTTDYTLSVDPGSQCTGIAITDSENRIVIKIELHHRGKAIKKGLSARAGHRRSRRTRKLRYREPRWRNRARKAPTLTADGWQYKKVDRAVTSKDGKPKQKWHPSQKGWIPPSLMSRVFNIETWVRRLCKVYPITHLAVEHVKFDTQKMANPEIEGVEYQQGTLHGYEVRQYLLEKFNHKCFYCGISNERLEIEHIIPEAKGGTHRVSNLTVSCKPCNREKGDRLPDEIGGTLGKRVEQALKAAGEPMKDAATVNSIRWKISETLEHTGLPLFYGTGGRTKHNRTQADLDKTHYYDAASVNCVPIDDGTHHPVLSIHAVGYGYRADLGDSKIYTSGYMKTVKVKDANNKIVMIERKDRKGKPYKMPKINKEKSVPAPGFRGPQIRIERCAGFARLDMVEIQNRTGRFIGSLNCFDETATGKPQKVRVKVDFTKPDGRTSGNITQIKKIMSRDGYAYTHHKPTPRRR